MYGMNGPELIAHLKVNDALREADRLHRVSAVLKERNAARNDRIARRLSAVRNGYAATIAALQSLIS